MKRFIILSTLLLWIVLGGFAFYYVNRPASNTDPKADYSMESIAFYIQFQENEGAANQKYLGKVIELSGTVREAGTDEYGQMTIMLPGDDLFGVNCKLSSKDSPEFQKIHKGDAIKIRGICSGKLMDVVLVNCSLENS